MSPTRRLLLLAVSAGLLGVPAYALDDSSNAPATDPSLEVIQTRVAKALKRPGVRSASWGIEIVDPEADRVLLSVNPDKPFKPASVMKVLTTSTALEKLGPDFRFRTGVYTDGNLGPDGTVAGNLIIVGRGDPNLHEPESDIQSDSALKKLAERLRDLGIQRVEGEVVGDDGYYEYKLHPKGWTARDLRTVYGAPVSALCYNNNVFTVYARATKPGKSVTVSTDLPTSVFRIRNVATTGGAKSARTLGARLVPGSRTITVTGVLPAGQVAARQIIVDNPPLVTAAVFHDNLRKAGIVVDGKASVYHDGDVPSWERKQWRLLAEHISPPLVSAVEIINKNSQNMHAEMLLRTLGAEVLGHGSDEAGISVVRSFLLDAGIESGIVQLEDGCGLSRDNLLTPHAQTSLLRFVASRPYFGLFLGTLAVSGTDGTLKNRLSAGPVRGVIHAKTGSLAGVTTLSGYMTTRSGRNLVFTIFANNVSRSMSRVKKTIDEICSLFVNNY